MQRALVRSASLQRQRYTPHAFRATAGGAAHTEDESDRYEEHVEAAVAGAGRVEPAAAAGCLMRQLRGPGTVAPSQAKARRGAERESRESGARAPLVGEGDEGDAAGKGDNGAQDERRKPAAVVLVHPAVAPLRW